MKLMCIVLIGLCACTAPKTNNTDRSTGKATVSKKPRLPVILRVEQVPENLQNPFRVQVVASGIDTIDFREAMKISLKDFSETYKKYGKTAAYSLPSKFNMLFFETVSDAQVISTISWKAYPMSTASKDTMTRYCTTPDSLRSQPGKAIAACIEVVMQSGVLK